MEILFFTEFSKRKNSTKVPDDSTGITKEVYLKGTTDKINPTFFLKGTDDYVSCKAWGWYYFVHRIGYDIDGAQMVYCNIDVLATFKSKILETRAFIDYSSSNYSSNVIDSRISHTVTKTWRREIQPSMFVDNFNTGCYILSTANTIHGPVNYIMDRENLELLINDLIEISPTEVTNWEELFGDAMGSVIGLRYVPIPYDHFDTGTNEEEVLLGDWNSGYQGIPHQGNITESRIISTPWTYSDFRRCSDFTRFVLALPFIGLVDLKPETLMGYDSIVINMVGNCVTGVVSYKIVLSEQTSNKIIATYNGEFGRQIPVAQGQVNLTGILNSGVAAGGAWAATAAGLTNPAVGVGVIGAAALNAIVASNISDFTIVGGYSGSYGEVLINNYEMYSIANDTRTDPASLTELYGRPCKQVHLISELSGFVQTSGFHIDISALDILKDMINSLMDSGVYLE